MTKMRMNASVQYNTSRRSLDYDSPLTNLTAFPRRFDRLGTSWSTNCRFDIPSYLVSLIISKTGQDRGKLTSAASASRLIALYPAAITSSMNLAFFSGVHVPFSGEQGFFGDLEEEAGEEVFLFLVGV